MGTGKVKGKKGGERGSGKEGAREVKNTEGKRRKREKVKEVRVEMKGMKGRKKRAVQWYEGKGKGKVFPYSLPSVGPGADPGVQAVSPQVT